MDTLDDYLNASPAEREAEKTRRGWATKPPAAQTHRGKPLSWEMRGYIDGTKPKRTPTHRADMAPITPAWTKNLLAALGKAPNNA